MLAARASSLFLGLRLDANLDMQRLGTSYSSLPGGDTVSRQNQSSLLRTGNGSGTKRTVYAEKRSRNSGAKKIPVIDDPLGLGWSGC
ncbi:MAG: hypothetical protein C4K49_01210 [Candidatus Thorarchaeota archaeon]|nr:MAG: hypothetical protein C4K49_01210 [Candidatus Thorarchaeota archaeon]